MENVVFVFNEVKENGFDWIELFGLITQVVTLLLAFYVFKQTKKIYREQKKIDLLHFRQEELKKELLELSGKIGIFTFYYVRLNITAIEGQLSESSFIEKEYKKMADILTEDIPILLAKIDNLISVYFKSNELIVYKYKFFEEKYIIWSKFIQKLLYKEDFRLKKIGEYKEANPNELDYLIKNLIDEIYKIDEL